MPPHADVLQWEHLEFPRSLPQFQRLFPDDAACGRWLESAKWPRGFTCPHCGEAKREPYRFEARPGVLRCKTCRRDVSLTAGTAMRRGHLPLTTWFGAAYMVLAEPDGSVREMQTTLRLTRYDTAHRLVCGMRGKIGRPSWRAFRSLLGLKSPYS